MSGNNAGSRSAALIGSADPREEPVQTGRSDALCCRSGGDCLWEGACLYRKLVQPQTLALLAPLPIAGGVRARSAWQPE
jgi:hypothetical protein